jgi:hypothetical protein
MTIKIEWTTGVAVLTAAAVLAGIYLVVETTRVVLESHG